MDRVLERGGRMVKDPLQSALDRLVEDGTLSEDQASAVRDEVRRRGGPTAYQNGNGSHHGLHADTSSAARSERVVEMLAYMGGALVLAAALVIASLIWDDLNRGSRLGICVGAGLILIAVAAVMTPRDEGGLPWQGPREGVSSTLAALGSAAVALGAGVGVTAHELAFAGVAMLMVAVACYVVWRGSLLVAAVFAAGVLLISALIDESSLNDSMLGIALVVLGYGVAVAAAGRLIREDVTAEVLGGLTALVGVELLCVDDDLAVWGLLAGLAMIVGCFALFFADRGVHFAVLGGLTALIVPATALGVLTEDAVLVGFILLIVGLLLIAGAVVVVRRDRRAPVHG